MAREFNVTGTCVPEMHYMVDISEKVKMIAALIQQGKYFTINRPRQYGKTTTLYMLTRYFQGNEDYLVVKISFEGIGNILFEKEEEFSMAFIELISDYIALNDEKLAVWLLEVGKDVKSFKDVSKTITQLVKKTGKKVVLIIDEVDKSSNNQLFLSLLGMLRNKYLSRNIGADYSFHSVILGGRA